MARTRHFDRDDDDTDLGFDMPGNFKVFVTYDGCFDEHPRFEGTFKLCIRFMERTRPPGGCEWDLVSAQTGRAISFVFSPRY